VKFVAYIDREGTTWAPLERAPGDPIVIEVHPDIRFEDAVSEALRAAGIDVEEFFFCPHFLRSADEPNPEIVPYPMAVVAEDGEFLWTEGARDRMTLSDLQRAREAGFFTGDPRGVFLDRLMGFDGVIPGWDEFFKWLLEFAFLGGVGQFVAFLRRKYKRWQDRGATSPYAFLDIVVARDEWDRRDLSQLLGLNEQEATDLLTSMGFGAAGDDPDRWTPSPDPNISALRRKIIEDYLRRRHVHEDEHGEQGEPES
jgi:hypothetical protein